jgi:hypothetical protein
MTAPVQGCSVDGAQILPEMGEKLTYR